MATAKKRGVGRPTKFTPETRQKVLTAIKAGNFREVAAGYAGISPATLRSWLARDPEFLAAVTQAEQEAEIRMVAIVAAAAAKDAKHAEWWLERKVHHRWGRKDRVAFQGTDDAGTRSIPVGAVLLVSASSRGAGGSPLKIGSLMPEADEEGILIDQ